ncbi:MAG: hypothetical protein E6Q92_13075 [Burkholderiaceae bacterium]|nr:MAG: hypothetical protein E6Q92_13075 [Burkholderiaceae bacterium]
MQAPLIPQAEDRILALRVADAAVTAWRELDAALSPIIGQRGVAALYQRSLYLTRIDYPWLAGVHQATVRAGEFAPLHTGSPSRPAPPRPAPAAHCSPPSAIS